MSYYIFNFAGAEVSEAVGLLRAKMWGVGTEEQHRDALVPGDIALIYLAAPRRTFIARVELGSAVHDWTASEAHEYTGDCRSGVLLAAVEEWDPPVPMSTVLPRIDRSAGARGDFDAGVVRITADEYETAVAAGTDVRP